MSLLSKMEKMITEGICASLPRQSVLKISGEDALSFLQGQLTQNLKSEINETEFIPCSRLTPQGLIKFNFFIKKINKDVFQILCSTEVAESLIEDLEKFIIIEDVAIERMDEVNLEFRSGFKSLSKDSFYSKITFGFDEGALFEVDDVTIKDELLAAFGMYSFFYHDTGKLISNSISAACALGLEKGCFVGQEVVSKIENNRGGAEFPFMVISSGESIDLKKEVGVKVCEAKGEIVLSECKLKREHRVHQSNLGEFIVLDFQKLNIYSSKGKSNALFLRAVDLINKGEKSSAKEILEQSLCFYPNNLDSLEALGVVFAELGDYKEAHKKMDKIIELEPNHVMARANKSLFFMREGKIEEAEREKEISAKLSMDSFSVELESERISKLKSQRSMYQEVLDIDSEDKFALEKFVEISFELREFDDAKQKINKFLDVDPENPKANLFNCLLLKEEGRLSLEVLDLSKKYAAKRNDKSALRDLEKIEI